MHKKKKNLNKQNYKHNKALPLITVPSFNTTQQVRIPTLSTNQLKNMTKSIQLKKSSINPPRKTQSKKTTCKNSRLHTVNYPIKTRSIMLSSKQLKNIGEKSHSNSKSPISRKSKSLKKYFTKKNIGSVQANPVLKSNSNFKLKKTIMQLQGNTFQTENDSLFQMKTSSDIANNMQSNQIIFSLTQDCIDIEQLRKYCEKKENKSIIQLSHKHLKHFNEHRAASKIQRAWRRYRTKRLVSRYVFLSQYNTVPRREIIEINEYQDLNSEQFSPYRIESTYNDNIVVLNQKTGKNENQQKWSLLFKKISNTDSNIINNQKGLKHEDLITLKVVELQKDAKKNKQVKYQSVLSNHSQQYNSQKYIQFFDADLFFKDHSKLSISNPHKITISKKKQQILFQSVAPHSSRKIVDNCPANPSQSMKNLHLSSMAKRYSLSKSNSEKVLKGSILSMIRNEQQIQDQSQINLDILTKQFLQGSNFCTQNFDMLYSQQKLRSKLAELNKMKEQFEQSVENITFRSNQDQLSYDQQYLVSKENLHEERVQLRRSHQLLQLHIPNQDEIKIQEEILQSQQSIHDEAKKDACCVLIQNALLIEVFQDIAKQIRILLALKNTHITSESVPTKKKKGFSTNKAQIAKFLQDIMTYLQNNEPDVFLSLQVPTGPSALEMLHYMHQQNQDQLLQNTDEGDEANVMVIPNRVFDIMWQIKQQSINITVPKYLDEQSISLFNYQCQVLKNLNKIFYRCMFDTFNECLDSFRNFGLYGKPFPWKSVPSFYHQKSQSQLFQQVQKARKKMMELSISYCGLIIEKQQRTEQINDEYIKQVQQDRLSRMLASDLLESQERWVFYDDEQTQILVEIANLIWGSIFKEAIQEIQKI